MDDQNDRQLKELFRERRLEEMSDAPSFESVWRGAENEARRPRRQRYAFAAAAAVAAVLVAVFTLDAWTDSDGGDELSGMVVATEYDDEFDEFDDFNALEEEEWEFLLALSDGGSPTDFLLQSDNTWFFELNGSERP
ncbi:MAG: hypothetical protein ACNA8W_05245 [Bradymonadaceae bacterium]